MIKATHDTIFLGSAAPSIQTLYHVNTHILHDMTLSIVAATEAVHEMLFKFQNGTTDRVVTIEKFVFVYALYQRKIFNV